MATSLITKKRIAKSFKKLLSKQSFEKISVRQIMEDAGIRRQTFYNHFLDKYELLEWIFQTELREQVTDNLEYISGYQLLQELLHYFNVNKSFYAQLFDIVDQNDFSSYFQTYCQQLVTKLVKEYHSCPFHSEMEYQFFIHYHSQALANAIKHLLDLSEQDYQQQAQLLTQLIKTAIEN